MPSPIPKNVPRVNDVSQIQRNKISNDESLYTVESINNFKIIYVAEPDYLTIVSFGKALRIPYPYVEELIAIYDDIEDLKRMGVSLDARKDSE